MPNHETHSLPSNSHSHSSANPSLQSLLVTRSTKEVLSFRGEIGSKPQLVLLDPRCQPAHNDETQHDHGPQLDVNPTPKPPLRQPPSISLQSRKKRTKETKIEIKRNGGRKRGGDNILAHIKARLRGRTNRRQRHEHDEIPGHPMVLVHLLRVLLAAEQRRDVELRDPDNGLQEKEDVGNEAQDGVWGVEIWGKTK